MVCVLTYRKAGEERDDEERERKGVGKEGGRRERRRRKEKGRVKEERRVDGNSLHPQISIVMHKSSL